MSNGRDGFFQTSGTPNGFKILGDFVVITKNARIHTAEKLLQVLAELQNVRWDVILFSETRASSGTKVLEGREFLRKKTSHKTKKKKRRIKKQKRDTTKVISRPTETIYTVEKDEPCRWCLEKRQQSSPAVMFARLRSNRRYKSGD